MPDRRSLLDFSGPRVQALMKEFLLQNPIGVSWSFCVRFQGLRDAYSDGLADWTLALPEADGHFIRHGSLITRDFKIGFRSDPQKPTLTGDEVKFDLIDDGSGQVFRTFASRYYGKRMRLAGDVAVDDNVINLETIGTLEVGDYLHFGTMETMRVSSLLSATQVFVNRAQFESRSRRFLVRGNQGTPDGVMGQWVSTSPVDFNNRIVEIFMAPVDLDSHTLDTDHVFPIWAGVIKNVDDDEGKIAIEAAPLQALLESSWPGRLATGKLGSQQQLIKVNEYMLTRGIQIWYRNLAAGGTELTGLETMLLPPGLYDELGVFNLIDPVTSAGWVPVSWAVRVLQDTINNLLATNTSLPWRQSGINVFENRLQFSLKNEANGAVSLRITVMPVIGIENFFPIDSIIGMGLDYDSSVPIFIRANMHDEPYRFFGSEVKLKSTDTDIPIMLDDAAVYPGEGTWELNGDKRGLIRISDGSNVELVSFSGVFTGLNLGSVDQAPRFVLLTDVKRGVGGTRAQDWGEFPSDYEAGKGDATIQELLYISDDPSAAADADALDPDAVVNGILMSAEDDPSYVTYIRGTTGLSTDTCRLTGYRMGLAIPKRYVDYEGIWRTMRRSGAADTIGAFWINEAGKGKEALEQFLMSYGLFFVTKQFMRNDTLYFGLSLESIISPTITSYDDVVMDQDRAKDSKPRATTNERLVINSISLQPWDKPAYGSKSDADPIFVYDEDSISAIGPAKTLELKPNIFEWFSSGTTAGSNYVGREAHIAIAIKVSERWFSAYGRGPYMLKMTVCAPVGWRFYAGDHVLVTLTGVRDPAGNPSMASKAARITRAEHQFGSRARSEIEMYVGFDSVAELAPNCVVTAISEAGVLTVDPSYYASGEPSADFTDAAFFDPAHYGDLIYCKLWVQGRYENSFIYVNVASRNGDRLTLETPLDSGSQSYYNEALADSRRVILGFREYDSAYTLRQRAYAHMADSVTQVLGTDETPKEYL